MEIKIVFWNFSTVLMWPLSTLIVIYAVSIHKVAAFISTSELWENEYQLFLKLQKLLTFKRLLWTFLLINNGSLTHKKFAQMSIDVVTWQ